MALAEYAPSYPVNVSLDPPVEPRNKMTVGFRFILAIPHALLVGGYAYFGFSFGLFDNRGGFFATGVLGAVAAACALICWFAILFANQHPQGLKDLIMFYLRWRTRAIAYMALFRDEYPPFGDEAYPASISVDMAEGERDKTSIALRLIYAIPHILILWALGVAWFITTVIAWFAILFTGTYPEGLYNFGVGVFRWSLRVEAYLLLLVDEYPPFSFES